MPPFYVTAEIHLRSLHTRARTYQRDPLDRGGRQYDLRGCLYFVIIGDELFKDILPTVSGVAETVEKDD